MYIVHVNHMHMTHTIYDIHICIQVVIRYTEIQTYVWKYKHIVHLFVYIANVDDNTYVLLFAFMMSTVIDIQYVYAGNSKHDQIYVEYSVFVHEHIFIIICASVRCINCLHICWVCAHIIINVTWNISTASYILQCTNTTHGSGCLSMQLHNNADL